MLRTQKAKVVAAVVNDDEPSSEQITFEGIRLCENELKQAPAIRLYYNKKSINKMDIYVFLEQIVKNTYSRTPIIRTRL